MAMDAFVNADRLAERCRRQVVTSYFGNDKIGMYIKIPRTCIVMSAPMAPEPEENCCDRCRTHSPPLCCDLCNPELMVITQESLEVAPGDGRESEQEDGGDEDDLVAMPLAPKVCKYSTRCYEATGWDKRLLQELWAWRSKVYDDYWAEVDEVGFGMSLVISDELVQRLVDLAHYGKLVYVTDIQTQTSWRDPMGLSDEIIDIIRMTHEATALGPLFNHTPRAWPSRSQTPISPSQPLTPAPPGPQSIAGSPMTPGPCKSTQCSVCRRFGHNGVLRVHVRVFLLIGPAARNKECPRRCRFAEWNRVQQPARNGPVR
jgi:hypothetical protein